MELSVRDDIIDKVRRGEMTPAQAEAEAVRLDVKPFAIVPEPARFDPFREPWWTLPMAVAWIAWRSTDRVREFWDPYRSECWDWQLREWRNGSDGPVYAGHFLEQRRPATLSLLSFVERHDSSQGLLPAGAISINDAKAKLWEALSEHALEATGISTDTGERTSIPACGWRNLRDLEERGRDALRVRDASGVWTDRGYNDVALRRQNIMAIWQPHRLEERRHELPALVKPEGPGYMPLYLAAQWIATRGGTVEIDPMELSIWQDAFAQLLPRLASEEIKVIGVRNGATETISALHFASCRVDYPYSDACLILSEELYLCSYPYIDDEHWRRGFDDSLKNRAGNRWERLMVLKSDVAHHWPFSLAQASGKTPMTTYQSGAPGRPTSMHLVEVEFRARLDRGEAETSIGAEARTLSEWLQKEHPDAPQLTAKAIANRLRLEHRRRVANAQK
jgi:hypothetical protein